MRSTGVLVVADMGNGNVMPLREGKMLALFRSVEEAKKHVQENPIKGAVGYRFTQLTSPAHRNMTFEQMQADLTDSLVQFNNRN